MSWYEAQSSLTCSACGKSFTAATAESINVTRMPGARIAILSAEFHRVECPSCHHRSWVDRQFLYTDIKRQQYVHVFPQADLLDWPRLEEVAWEVFYGGFKGPAGIQAMAAEYRTRAVFGPNALADKLRIWDAGLDDALVELLKLELFTTLPQLRGRPDLSFVVIAVTDELIEVEVTSRGGGAAEHYGMRRARYHELE